ncbi:energy-coupling factor ABC transporter permease [Neptuniibacter sp. CAU 1671]|uniref:energy-coupling factor ABC transporter permease n=1 Tax=Neptuniibacter sp. CAU 1671 TaxID=3032593 RepID=UPI0023DC24A8|nr:energy-coupling factor ABC transporter permease [Neptuniibacter sp. CAU 1671]MDF2181748.1 energy-coupling factor ABC transporter permease [Neptuniibacter sp. CAU 1671]
MSFSSDLFSTAWIWISGLIYGLILFAAIWRAPWPVIAGNRTLQHMLFGATVVLMILWSMRAGISPGLGIHFMGVTLLTLVFGWDLAILSATAALIGMAVIGRESWEGLFLNGLCSVALPVSVSWLVYHLVDRYLPKNFFIYLFVCGFFGAAVAVASAGVFTSFLLVVSGVYTLDKIVMEYLRYLPLIMFPEGLLNGIILTGLLVFHPDWIRTFNAKIYIDDQ